MRALPTEAERRWVSGCKNYYKFVKGAGAKAKTVTSNLPILSVLAAVYSVVSVIVRLEGLEISFLFAVFLTLITIVSAILS